MILLLPACKGLQIDEQYQIFHEEGLHYQFVIG